MGSSSTTSKDDFSVLVLASDLGIDAQPFLTHQEPKDSWYDCTSDLPSSEEQDFAHINSRQFLRLESGSDKLGNRIFRIVGKYFSGLFTRLYFFNSSKNLKDQ
ncbi:hypothetical protein R3W88_011687 [Solanum pinnatisectum]|uniref:Uncharacterized protein n=1 Tax=Solanum pinnatisectum TaxID=50273 RepID=A0AAV9L817_9SOLN|nr:hypothetical protein R3W88_011687 [Solanum pinnatisectum]